MSETIKCPYCDDVVTLKKAKRGQGFHYLRCNECNILIWFYGGVPKSSSKSVEDGSKKEKSLFEMLGSW